MTQHSQNAPAIDCIPRILTKVRTRADVRTGGNVARLAILSLAALLLAGCVGDGGGALSVPLWTLVSLGGTSDVTLPAHVGGRLPPGPTHYELKAHVTLPPEFRDQPLTLGIAYFPALATLRAGGHETVSLESSALDRYRAQGPHRWRIAREDTHGESLDLVIDVEHTWTQSAWINTVPTLSRATSGDPRVLFVEGFNEVTAEAAIATTLLMAFTYGVLFLLDRRRTTHGWFGLQSLVSAAYPSLVMGLMQPLLGTWDIVVTGVAISIAAISTLQFIAAIAEEAPPTRAWWLAVVATMVAFVFAHDPFRSSQVCAVCAAATIATACGRQIVVSRGKPISPTVRVFKFGFPLAAMMGIPDIVAFSGLGEMAGGLRTGSLGFVGVSLIQALALSRSHIESLRRADELNVELASRVTLLEKNNEEIRLLNGELRRLIAARSERLADTLAKLGPMAPSLRTFVPGDIVEGRYRVDRRIGEGGMGTVYEVERLTDAKKLALKVLHAPRSGAELSRLAREAELASRIDHPNVVGIKDVDVSESGTLFLVMDLIDGPPLEDMRARFAELPWALRILAQIASGLAALHEQGVVHRDLKPGNVLVARGPGGDVAKIADFGIAMRGRDEIATVTVQDTPVTPVDGWDAPRQGDGPITHTGQVMGTPCYMAPELVRGARLATPASDVYSFGVIAWELLTGALPEGFEALAHLRRSIDVASIATLVPALTPRLAKILDACLANDAALRPTARALATNLATSEERTGKMTDAPRGIPAA